MCTKFLPVFTIFHWKASNQKFFNYGSIKERCIENQQVYKMGNFFRLFSIRGVIKRRLILRGIHPENLSLFNVKFGSKIDKYTENIFQCNFSLPTFFCRNLYFVYEIAQ